MLGGLASDNADLVGRGLSAIEWGLQPIGIWDRRRTGATTGITTTFWPSAHPRTMFGAAAAETVRAILEDDTLPAEIYDRPRRWFLPLD